MACETQEPIVIFKGADKEIRVRLVVKDTMEPLDLTGATVVSAIFLKADNTTLTKTLGSGVAIGSALGGKIVVTLTDADTALLKDTKQGSFEVLIKIGSDDHVVQFRNILDIRPRLFQ